MIYILFGTYKLKILKLVYYFYKKTILILNFNIFVMFIYFLLKKVRALKLKIKGLISRLIL